MIKQFRWILMQIIIFIRVIKNNQNIATLLQDLERYEESIEINEISIKLDPTNAKFIFNKGNI